MLNVKDFHTLNCTSFVSLVTQLFNTKDSTNTYFELGRLGQEQGGIDIFSEKFNTVIQCKYKDDLTSPEKIRKVLYNDLKKDVEKARKSKWNFNHFILVSTHRDDANLQYLASKLKDDKEYTFNISYIGWDQIRKWLIQFPQIHSRFFKNFQIPHDPVELVSIGIDEDNCAWEAQVEPENTFYLNSESKKSKYPVFDFTFINHLDRTIVLKSIHLWAKELYSGMMGIPVSTLLESSHTYQLKFLKNKESVLRATPPLEIPKEQAFRFCLETVFEYEDKCYPLNTRNIFFFEFRFSSNVVVSAPKVFINTNEDIDSIPLYILT